MLMPHTRGLLELLGRDELPEESMDAVPLEPERQSLDDPRGFELRMKKKRRAALLTAMLREQGYGDLAKMAALRETRGIGRDDSDGY
jgi:hypothetical protein